MGMAAGAPCRVIGVAAPVPKNSPAMAPTTTRRSARRLITSPGADSHRAQMPPCTQPRARQQAAHDVPLTKTAIGERVSQARINRYALKGQNGEGVSLLVSP